MSDYDYRAEAERFAALGQIATANVYAMLALAESFDVIGAELYRIRVAVEVLAGEALDREQGEHPAGGELRHVGRLGVDGFGQGDEAP